MSSSMGVVVVHFGDPEPTRRCLEAILSDRSLAQPDILVVDNSGNFPAAYLPDGVERLPSADNPGFGEGANRGFRYLLEGAALEYLLVLNHDVEIRPGFLDAACKTLEKEGVGAASGPIYSRRSKAPSKEGLSPGRETLWYAGGSIDFLTGTVRQETSPDALEKAREVGFLPGTALAMSARAFLEIGGFDPRFFLYNEDVDLCLRLRSRGFRLFFEPSMVSFHALGEATGSADRSPLYLENLTAGRLLPFRNRFHRAYLGALHTPYVLLRCANAVAKYGWASGSRISALMRGHARALVTIFKEPGRPASAPTPGPTLPKIG